MPEKWTANIVAKLHLNKITKKRLAEQLGDTPEYISMVLNGHKTPKNAARRFNTALDELIAAKEKEAT